MRLFAVALAVALVYFVLWSLLRQNVRFLLPVVPLLSVVVVWCGSRCDASPADRGG